MKKRIIIVISALLSVCLLAVLFIRPYKSIDDSSMTSNTSVEVIDKDSYYFFDGPKDDKAFIFYPGGNVDAKAYGNLLKQIAQNGIDCFLLEMPLDLAIFKINAADIIIENYDYEDYYIGGHSLGGTVASIYLEDKTDEFDGVLLFASYFSKDLSDTDLRVLSIYGDKDGVLNMKSYEKAKAYLPSDYEEIILVGGNHSNFGDYGLQKKDNEPDLTPDKQKEMVVNSVVEFINK